MSLLSRWRGRKRSAPILDPPGYRLDGPMSPAAPLPPPVHGAPEPLQSPERPVARPAMRLMLADGTIEELPADPEMAARAEYLIKSMLPPAPPPPPASS